MNIPQLIPQEQIKVKPSKKTSEREKVEEQTPVVGQPVVVEQQPVVLEQPVVVEEQPVVVEQQPVIVEQQAEVEQPVVAQQPEVERPAVVAPPAPVFKVQVLTSSSKLKAGDARFKGLTGVDSYQEGGIYKYTVGASENYNEINRLRRKVSEKFPGAFIIAFKKKQLLWM